MTPCKGYFLVGFALGVKAVISFSLRRVWSLLPRFGIAYALSLTVLVFFVLWIWFDRSFRWVPWIAGQDLRLQFLHDADLRELHQWDFHGPRMLVFWAFATLGLIATTTVGVRLFVGPEPGRTIRSMLLATALLALWLGLFASYEQLWWLAFRHGILRHQDAMKASEALLSEHWPTERICLPGLGHYVPAGVEHDLLYIDDESPNGLTDFHESFDRISRGKTGDMSFAVGSYPGWWVHHLGEGRVPKSYTVDVLGILIEMQLQVAVEVEDGWYLAQYIPEIATSSSGSAGASAAQPGQQQ